ncbi:MAG: stage II sporulation protein M [Propionicimonas sp.]|nr:stage II sporulation protein M [Propionicimonas sp.]
MDVDVFAAAHGAQWARLDDLARRRRLTGREADELVRLYRQGATHLSVLRSTAPDPALVSQLSVSLVRARARIASPHDLTWRHTLHFLTRTIPAALYRVRWWSVAVTLACLAVIVTTAVWTGSHPDVLDAMMSPEEQRHYAEQAFAAYYSEYPNASFAALVWTNNALIAALCIATGITGLYPAQVLFFNSLNVGVAAAVMHRFDGAWVFYSLILPHGLLELTCVFVAGAAGMRLFWSWLVPGPRSRGQSLAQEGRTTMVIVVALVLGLFVSGLIEGFVTPSGLNPWLKIAIGALACAGWWVVTFVLGRRAVELGTDPGLSDEEARAEVAVTG